MKNSIAISLLCLAVGIIYYCVYQGLLIIKLPSSIKQDEYCAVQVSKKNVIIYYFSQGIKTESVSVMWSTDKSQALQTLVKSWLAVLDDAECMPKKFSLQTAMVSGTDAYVSFSHSPFDKDESVYDKWMRIESLLKTIKVHNLGIAQVHFLVHHNPLNDPHLDFSRAWPISGFSD